MKKSEAIAVWRLAKKWTEAEVKARLGRIDNLEFADATQEKIDCEDAIRKIIYGTSDMVHIGIQLGILSAKKKRKI